MAHSSLFLARPLAFLACCFSVPLRAPAQPPPVDPVKTQILSAARLNGLAGEGLGPWHLKASYTLFDDAGNPASQGAIEEFWTSPTQYKRILTGQGFQQTSYGSARGELRPATQGNVPSAVALLPAQFIQPLPPHDVLDRLRFVLEQRELGGAKFDCIVARGVSATGHPLDTGLTWCLDAGKPILRISDDTFEKQRVLYTAIAAFRGRYVAQGLRIIDNGKPVLNARLETLEVIPSGKQPDFTPPPDAAPVNPRINVSAGVAQGMLIHQTRPEYPGRTAGQSGTVGAVTLDALIDPTGHVTEAHATGGPLILQQPAVDAVKNWLYRPCLRNGEPVEVHTTIRVDFDPFQ